ncbi:hypothetical protein [Clostridium sp. JN-9]|uniref:hypothetical protein n=1 Tax=Clostridium sp. JN-9 TaxID=2507159 RepID=UPI000FFE2EAB|nr:hypothetical protein [Clostridium sp. JN-9]QAT39531.1 hypothetical protein EQM05_04290 [Clostridium sp. JN-9]
MTDIEKVRLNIQDKDSEIFTDDEITAFIADEGDINGATAKALEIMAMLPEGLIKNYARGEISMVKTTILELAQYYRSRQEKENKFRFYVIPRGDGLGVADINNTTDGLISGGDSYVS